MRGRTVASPLATPPGDRCPVTPAPTALPATDTLPPSPPLAAAEADAGDEYATPSVAPVVARETTLEELALRRAAHEASEALPTTPPTPPPTFRSNTPIPAQLVSVAPAFEISERGEFWPGKAKRTLGAQEREWASLGRKVAELEPREARSGVRIGLPGEWGRAILSPVLSETEAGSATSPPSSVARLTTPPNRTSIGSPTFRRSSLDINSSPNSPLTTLLQDPPETAVRRQLDGFSRPPSPKTSPPPADSPPISARASPKSARSPISTSLTEAALKILEGRTSPSAASLDVDQWRQDHEARSTSPNHALPPPPIPPSATPDSQTKASLAVDLRNDPSLLELASRIHDSSITLAAPLASAPIRRRVRSPQLPREPLTDAERVARRARRLSGESPEFGTPPDETIYALRDKAWKASTEFRAEKRRLESRLEHADRGARPRLLNKLAELHARQPIESVKNAAESYWVDSLALDPEQLAVYLSLGKWHRHRGSNEIALKYFDAATKLAPTSPHAWLSLALTASSFSPPRRRIIGLAYSRATQLAGPDTAIDSWYGLGRYYEFLADPVELRQAERCYVLALEALENESGSARENELRQSLEDVREKRTEADKGAPDPGDIYAVVAPSQPGAPSHASPPTADAVAPVIDRLPPETTTPPHSPNKSPNISSAHSIRSDMTAHPPLAVVELAHPSSTPIDPPRPPDLHHSPISKVIVQDRSHNIRGPERKLPAGAVGPLDELASPSSRRAMVCRSAQTLPEAAAVFRHAFVQTTSPPVSVDTRERSPIIDSTWTTSPAPSPSASSTTGKRHSPPLSAYLPTLDRAIECLRLATAQRTDPTPAAAQLALEFGEFSEQFCTTFGVDRDRIGKAMDAVERIGRRVSARGEGGHA